MEVFTVGARPWETRANCADEEGISNAAQEPAQLEERGEGAQLQEGHVAPAEDLS